MRKNKKILLSKIQTFITKNKTKAKEDLYNFDDDYKTFRMIYALASLFPVDDEYNRNEPEVEKQLKELWYLYFFFKHKIEGKNIKYSNIVKKYC